MYIFLTCDLRSSGARTAISSQCLYRYSPNADKKIRTIQQTKCPATSKGKDMWTNSHIYGKRDQHPFLPQTT